MAVAVVVMHLHPFLLQQMTGIFYVKNVIQVSNRSIARRGIKVVFILIFVLAVVDFLVSIGLYLCIYIFRTFAFDKYVHKCTLLVPEYLLYAIK